MGALKYMENNRVCKGEKGKLLIVKVLALQIESWSAGFIWEPKCLELEMVTEK
jgi:hypothetical protein